MNLGDPKHLDYLRDLPSGYILDLLADSEGLDEFSARRVLQDRGYTADEIDQMIDRRRHSRWPRRPTLWRIARWASLFNALIITIFNLVCLTRLLLTDAPYTFPLLLATLVCGGFGFFLGYKLTTHVYQGGTHQLHCGFPIPVGFVSLDTGKEQVTVGANFILRIAINALVGVNFTILPLMVIYIGAH
jgi:hypothetical protein